MSILVTRVPLKYVRLCTLYYYTFESDEIDTPYSKYAVKRNTKYIYIYINIFRNGRQVLGHLVFYSTPSVRLHQTNIIIILLL